MQNPIISNIKISCKIDLPASLDYVRKRCSEKKLRVKDFQNFLVIYGKFVILLFKASKVFCSQHANITKIRTLQDIPLALKELSDLTHTYVDVDDKESYKIDNLTVTGNLETKINLADFAKKNSELPALRYSPEVFPAVFMKFDKINSIVFSSGKCVFTGAKELEQVEPIFKLLKEKCQLAPVNITTL